VVDFFIQVLTDFIPGFRSDCKTQPVGFRLLVGGSDNRNLISVFQNIFQGFIPVIDNTSNTLAPDIGVNSVRKIQ
jgi:hypothetical protein